MHFMQRFKPHMFIFFEIQYELLRFEKKLKLHIKNNRITSLCPFNATFNRQLIKFLVPVWLISLKFDKDLLERVQNRATRHI